MLLSMCISVIDHVPYVVISKICVNELKQEATPKVLILTVAKLIPGL